jgi:hypothetical protein
MGSGCSFGWQDVLLQGDLDCAREPHMPPWVGLEWACRDLSNGLRHIFNFGHHDHTWRWLDWYFFYIDVFSDTFFGHQVQWSQVF